MATNTGTWVRARGGERTDNKVHGKMNKHIDRRTVPDCSKEWERDVVIDDGKAYVPLESVHELLSENQELREALFHQMTDCQETAIQKMYSLTGHSTKEILKYVASIEKATQMAMTRKDVFNFLYSEMARNYGLDLSDCPPDISKLQCCWQRGWLPVVSTLVVSLHTTILWIKRKAPADMSKICKEISKPEPKKSVLPF